MESKLKQAEYYYNVISHEIMMIWREKNRPVGREWLKISEEEYYNRDFIYGLDKKK